MMAKGRKRKQRESFDEDVEEYNQEQKQSRVKADEQRETAAVNDQKVLEETGEKEADLLEGIPIVPTLKRGVGNNHPGIIFLLEKASLEVAKVGKSYQILNSNDHCNFLLKKGRNPFDYRPDIVHKALLSILDHPLNKAGKVHAVYVKTQKDVLFEVKPHVRIPRKYQRFSNLILQLLQNLSIASKGKRENLLRVKKNPVSQYFPINSKRIGFSHSSDKLVKMRDYIASVSDDTPLIFVVGAMAHGKIDTECIDDSIAISHCPLSAAWCVSMICNAVRRHLRKIERMLRKKNVQKKRWGKEGIFVK